MTLLQVSSVGDMAHHPYEDGFGAPSSQEHLLGGMEVPLDGELLVIEGCSKTPAPLPRQETLVLEGVNDLLCLLGREPTQVHRHGQTKLLGRQLVLASSIKKESDDLL